MYNTSTVLVLRHWGRGLHLKSQFVDRDLKWAPLYANRMCYHRAIAQEATQNSFWIDNYEILKKQLYNVQHLMCSMSYCPSISIYGTSDFNMQRCSSIAQHIFYNSTCNFIMGEYTNKQMYIINF